MQGPAQANGATLERRSADGTLSLEIDGQLVRGESLRVAVVVARFNSEITERLHAAAVARLIQLGVPLASIVTSWVPGAFEIPLMAKAHLRAGADAVLALGCVIRGETTHYESVCNAVERGCTMVQLEFARPVVFGVVTTENVEQARDRAGGRHGNKGAEAADVAIEMFFRIKGLT
jgi:6,7-dimethyl-8-ribityllumazine synthase